MKGNLRRIEPRLVTYKELRRILLPYVRGWSWADDAIWDLWTFGAPVPQDRCPGDTPCKQYPKCEHIRRILSIAKFAQWYDEVAQRQAKEISIQEMLRGKLPE